MTLIVRRPLGLKTTLIARWSPRSECAHHRSSRANSTLTNCGDSAVYATGAELSRLRECALVSVQIRHQSQVLLCAWCLQKRCNARRLHKLRSVLPLPRLPATVAAQAAKERCRSRTCKRGTLLPHVALLEPRACLPPPPRHGARCRPPLHDMLVLASGGSAWLPA